MIRFLALALAVSVPAAAAAGREVPSEKAQTVTGTVLKVQAPEHTISVTLSDGTQAAFRWNAETKINGVLAPGARVTVRYTVGEDGNNVAQQITVARS
jgi:hypothetical protein